MFFKARCFSTCSVTYFSPLQEKYWKTRRSFSCIVVNMLTSSNRIEIHYRISFEKILLTNQNARQSHFIRTFAFVFIFFFFFLDRCYNRFEFRINPCNENKDVNTLENFFINILENHSYSILHLPLRPGQVRSVVFLSSSW